MNDGVPQYFTLNPRNLHFNLESALWYNPGPTIDRRNTVMIGVTPLPWR